ncbi:hypothetical protein WOLCODRAFT_29297 [Wolfiporia cocos MD-104 SS10]|uniref:Protein CPL1-like domain-containing protein n=1 Tax=Wolfiporia cocos (strain MD-104) TaxID=742152 RepID=A0A2H3JBL0_WOLCO|nr:hypothetical protein WOLCODRAFT_29297 [Wolfiporia cocos MD-104 SS10]
MKLTTALVPLLAATSSFAAAVRSSLTRGARNDVIAARQAHVQRDLVDVCAGLDVDFEVLDIIFGHLEVCLCISLIPDFIEADVIVQAAVDVAGVAVVTAQLEALINDASGKQTCHYPDHAAPFCDFDWPCGFNCTNGYVPFTPSGSDHPTQCTCPPPWSECNGVCGSFPHGCGSATPGWKRSAPSCAAGKQMCGIAGGSSGKGWECVDTTSDLESCGGCMAPSPFTPFGAVTGVDCSAIPNIASVGCQASQCVVSSCIAGYVPSSARDSCVPALTIAKRDLADAGVAEAAAAVVEPVVAVAEAAAAGVHIARDILIGAAEAATAVVEPIAAVGEAGVVGVKVLRDIPVLEVVEEVGAVVDPLVAVGEAGVAGVAVGRDIVAGVAEVLEADVAGLVGVTEGAAAGVAIARDIVAGVAEGLEADVAGIVGVTEGAVAGVYIARDLDILGAEGLGAVVAPVAAVAEAGAAAVHVARDLPVVDEVPVVGAAVGVVAGAVVPGVAAVAAGAGAGVAIL